MTAVNMNYIPQQYLDANGQLTISDTEAQRISEGVAAKIKDMPPAQQQMFLMMLQSADLSPNGELTPEGMNDALDRLGTAAAALDDLMSIKGNVMDLLARLMVEQAGQERKDALDQRLQARESAKNELLDQAGKLKDAAEKMLSGALAAFICTIVMSVVSIVMSAISMSKAAGAFSTAKSGEGMSGEAFQGAMSQSQALGGRATAIGALGNAITGVGNALGSFVKSEQESQAKKIEAEGSISAAEAQYAQGQADIKKEMQDALNQMIQAIMNFIKEMKEAEVNMMQAITRG